MSLKKSQSGIYKEEVCMWTELENSGSKSHPKHDPYSDCVEI